MIGPMDPSSFFSLPLGAISMFTFPPLNVTGHLGGGGEGGKAVDVSVGHFRTKAN